MNLWRSSVLVAVAAVIAAPVATVAESKPNLTITVRADKDTDFDAQSRSSTRSGGCVTSSSSQVISRDSEIGVSIVIRNVSQTAVGDLQVRHAVLQRDRQSREISVVAHAEQALKLDPGGAHTITLDPLQFKSSDSRYSYKSSCPKIGSQTTNTRTGRDYYGTAVAVFWKGALVAKKYDPTNVDVALEKLNWKFADPAAVAPVAASSAARR